MKYKLGQKYYLINMGWIEEILFHSVLIALDGAGVYSKEHYYDSSGVEIVTVHNKDKQDISIPIFNTESKAIDYQIKVLKALKHKEAV